MKLCMLGQSSRMVLAATMIASTALVAAPAAYAQAAPEAAQQFDIPAGDLTVALQAFSARTGMQLGYSAELTSGKRSPGVSGSMSPREALGRLLGGTGLSAQISGNSATLVAAGDVAAAEGERLLGPVRVEGSQGGSYQPPVRGEGIAQLGGIRGQQDLEADGYRPNVVSVSGGVPTAIEDVPRSVTVITQEQIEKQDIVDIGDALTRAPGVTIVESGLEAEGDATIYVRGYEISKYQVDGGSARDLDLVGNGLLNLDAYERIELVRGPNALFTGELSAGGSINLIRKRPSANPVQSIELEGGSFGRIGAVADISEPTLFGSNIGLRVVASARRRRSYIDDYDVNTRTFYAIFDAPLGDAGRVEFGWNHSSTIVDGENLGLPRYLDGDLIPLPRSFNQSVGGLYNHSKSDELFLNTFVNLGENWDFEFNAFSATRRSKAKYSSANYYLDEPGLQPFGPGQIFIREKGKSNPTNIGLSGKVTGKFDTFGLRHDVFLSVNTTVLRQGESPLTRTTGVVNIGTLDDLLNPVIIPSTVVDLSEYLYSNMISRQLGVVVGDTISWRDKAFFTFTARRDWFRSNRTQAVSSDDGTETEALFTPATEGSATWRPSYSLVVKPTKNISLFGSYADTFVRLDGSFSRIGNGPDYSYEELPPATYENIEFGAKYARSRWIASISFYKLKNTGGAVQDSNLFECPPGVGPGGFVSPCFVRGGVASSSKGVDFELTGEIVKGLSVIANVNYNKTFQLSPFTPQRLPLQSLAPRTSANLFLDWTPSFVEGLSAQLGVRYKSRYYADVTSYIFDQSGGINVVSFPVEEKSYVVIDAGIEKSISDNVKLKLFVENVTDKKYLSTISSGFAGGSFYGSPRSFMASLLWSHKGQRSSDDQLTSAPFGNLADWYFGLDGGFTKTSDIVATASGKALDGESDVRWRYNVKPGATFGAKLGYYLTPRLHAELEGRYTPGEFGRIGGNESAPFGVCGDLFFEYGAGFDCDNVKGQFDRISLFTNLLYDFVRREARFVPYVGAGIGFTRSSIAFRGKLSGVGTDAPWDFARAYQEQISAADTSLKPSAQLIAGLSFRLNSSVNVDISWKHQFTPGVKWSTYNLDSPTFSGFIPNVIGRIGDFKSDVESDAVSVGVRLNFGTL